jgi:Glycosyl hydrolases family 18
MRGRGRACVIALLVAGSAALPVALQPNVALAATPIPAHVFAPYFETWTNGSIATVAEKSGARYFTLAFLETLKRHPCALAWDGDRDWRLRSGRYLSDIASLRDMGGDVIPSFGGWSADQHRTEIGDSCKDPEAIAAAYESVVERYDVTRLDMDVEGRSLRRTSGIDRRNQAIKLLQDWAAENGRTVQIQYTLPTSTDGLEDDALAVLQNAVDNGVRVDVVNPMVFDFWTGVTTDMGAAAVSAEQGLHDSLAALYPTKTSAELWAMQGATMMQGIDDYPKETEVTRLGDARTLLDFATTNGMSTLSMWAIQRDNGKCPGTPGANDCSGIHQDRWAFTDLLEPFTGP